MNSRFNWMSEWTSEKPSQPPKLFQHGPPVPALWLFGKAQSGKTSIVRFLTGAEEAAIGNGFQPETKATYHYPFPTESFPLLRFLDTRGLGEAQYDPAEDIQSLQHEAHAMIVTVRVNDFALKPLVEPLRQIRAARPNRPIVLALTWLHALYPQSQHPDPDPFWQSESPESVPQPLRRLLSQHKRDFEGLVDRIVPIDFTRTEDGFDQPYFGGDRLKDALIELLPSALGEAIRHTDDTLAHVRDELQEQASRITSNYAKWAAGLGSVPVPFLDIATVAGIQLRLVARLAKIYGQRPLPATLVTGLPLLGSRVLLQQGVKFLWRRVPFLSMPTNAASAYLATVAVGKAAAWYYWRRFLGSAPSSEEFHHEVSQLQSATRLNWNRPAPKSAGEES